MSYLGRQQQRKLTDPDELSFAKRPLADVSARTRRDPALLVDLLLSPLSER